MRVERGDGLLEISRGLELRRFELDAAGLVVEVDTQNLGRIARRQVGRLCVGDSAAVAEDQAIAVGAHPLRLTLMQYSPPFFSRTVKQIHWTLSERTVSWYHAPALRKRSLEDRDVLNVAEEVETPSAAFASDAGVAAAAEGGRQLAHEEAVHPHGASRHT